MTKKKELTVNERRSVEEAKLWKALEELSDNKKKVVEKTVIDAAFKAIQLEDLHKVIQEEGVIEEYQNGNNQSGRKVSSNVQVYNSLDKSYQSQIKILLDTLPKEAIIQEQDDGFESFMMER
ncbi:hypothetical protein [Bacillus pseudomycoides]|uniref:hypothetical protein n=1 Tax=Bacillus pseudomycoides TaxID=64104 RepID=UPI000BEDF546|nr:hypothetical protein [Bacillus pseudomycoides]PEE39383.1 hypothetical protein COO02_18675 [Bacillus pseudomycoides]PGA90707.1 hypothetical protein COL91_12555 [Bacillus pseudomycoides]PHF50641.1 hypothetical protein COF72_03435 [Bacillus pseudomycoides]